MSLFNKLITTALLILTFSVSSAPAPVNESTTSAETTLAKSDIPWSPAVNDIRVLEIRVARFVLDNVIAGYQYQDVILLPLGALSESIDIAISTSPQNNIAKGFIFKKERTFYLDTDQHEVTLNGITQKYTPDLVHVLLDDIYVESNLLSSWFKIQLNVNLFSSQLLVVSEEPLPFQKRLEREKKIAQTLSRIKPEPVYYPRHYEPYKNYSTPFIDQTLSTRLEKLSTGDTNLAYNYTTYVTTDLAKLESSWYMSGSDNEAIDDFRVTFGRKDEESKLLGPLKATDFSFGYIYEPKINLITQSASLQRGFTASNFEIGRQLEYDKHTFIGDLQPGWEVELYHNNSLIGYQSEAENGQYRFVDIPLLYGSNHFRIVFYGPQGQLREEETHFELGNSLTQVGKHYYKTSISEDEDGGSRLIAQYDFGLKKNLSASVNFSSIPLDINTVTEQHNFLNIGLRSFYDQFFFNIDIAKDATDGSAIELGVQSSINDFIIGFDHTILNNFISEEFFSTTNPLISRTNARLNTSITTSFLPRIPIGFEITKDSFQDGTATDSLTNQLSFNARNVSYSNQLTTQKTTNLPGITFGTFQLSQTGEKYSLRGDINYTFSPNSEITNTSLNYDLKDFYEYLLKLSLTHSLVSGITEVRAVINKPLKEYNLSYGAKINSNSEISLEVNFSIGIGQKPRNQEWITQAQSLATSGNISARVFLDTDQNGIFSNNDIPLEDVGFIINRSNKPTLTDSNGVAFLPALSANTGVDISIAKGTLVDPLWSSVIDGIHAVPRPGTTIELDFPIFLAGEIDGTVFLENKGRSAGVGNLRVEIVNAKNQVIRYTDTSYDGFYIISDIPTGQYRVRVNTDSLSDIKIKDGNNTSISINEDNRYINGIDITLTR